jgi:hypothetical protein
MLCPISRPSRLARRGRGRWVSSHFMAGRRRRRLRSGERAAAAQQQSAAGLDDGSADQRWNVVRRRRESGVVEWGNPYNPAAPVRMCAAIAALSNLRGAVSDTAFASTGNFHVVNRTKNEVLKYDLGFANPTPWPPTMTDNPELLLYVPGVSGWSEVTEPRSTRTPTPSRRHPARRCRAAASARTGGGSACARTARCDPARPA